MQLIHVVLLPGQFGRNDDLRFRLNSDKSKVRGKTS
jgi:hypothetical protein